MLRTLLVGILALSAVAACSGKSDPPAAQPGAVAGEVLEVSGKATATRGTEVRVLARGSEISADDVIDTGAESHVAILLSHNNARWDLGPSKHGKVGDSLAWTAAKVDRPAGAVIEATSTAGRHAEKTAATTDTTAARNESDPEMTPKGPASPPTKPSAPGGAPEPAAGGATAVTPSPPPPPPPPRAQSNVRPMDSDKAETELAEQADTELRATPKPDPKLDPKSDRMRSPTVGSRRSGGSGIGPPHGDSGSSPDQMLRLEINKTIANQRTALGACLEGTERLVVLVTVTKGAYSFSTTDAAATDKTRACLAKVAATLTSKTKLDALVRVRTIIVK